MDMFICGNQIHAFIDFAFIREQFIQLIINNKDYLLVEAIKRLKYIIINYSKNL